MDDEIGGDNATNYLTSVYGYVPMESTYIHTSSSCVDYHIDGLVQVCSNSNGVTVVLC